MYGDYAWSGGTVHSRPPYLVRTTAYSVDHLQRDNPTFDTSIPLITIHVSLLNLVQEVGEKNTIIHTKFDTIDYEIFTVK